MLSCCTYSNGQMATHRRERPPVLSRSHALEIIRDCADCLAAPPSIMIGDRGAVWRSRVAREIVDDLREAVAFIEACDA